MSSPFRGCRGSRAGGTRKGTQNLGSPRGLAARSRVLASFTLLAPKKGELAGGHERHSHEIFAELPICCLFKVVSGTEWLAFSDFIEQAIMQRQSYILMGYSPFLSVAFHMFYATQSYSKLSYPSSQYEVGD